MEDLSKYERYQRQVILKEFGTSSQDKLLQSKVLVAGAGGLGCPALQYLAAVGVGTIGIIDFDNVEISNLHRQTLFGAEDIGKPKVEIAARKLQAMNPWIHCITYPVKLVKENALEIIKNHDLVIDGTDNFSTRYLVNDACVLLDKPLVYGAVLRFEGQVGVFNCLNKKDNYKTNYRDLFPVAPLPSTVPSCNEAGVIGVLPGIIGTMQAAEAIKIITGIGESLCNKILTYNFLNNSFYEFSISPSASKNSIAPTNESEFLKFDYDWFCGIKKESLEISVNDFENLIKNEEVLIVDVREIGELPEVNEFAAMKLPLSSIQISVPFSMNNKTIVLFCQSGIRSLKAAKILKEMNPGYQLYSLQGGIEAWKKQQDKNYHYCRDKLG